MTKKELLNTYRAKVIELEELRYQLSRVGTDGRPSGCRTSQMDRLGGTNNPNAAAMHLAEGLEAMTLRREEELEQLRVPVDKLLSEITDVRTYMAAQHYYVYGRTDEEIGQALSISRTRANQLRRDYVNSL